MTLLPVGLPSVPAPPSPPAPVAQQAPPSSPALVAQQTPAADVEFRWRDHPQLRSGRLFRIDFVAKFQWDARHPGDDPPDFDDFEIQRARIGIEGEFFNRVQFAVERELTEVEADDPGDPPRSAWKDVY